MNKENKFFEDYQNLIESFGVFKKDTDGYNYKYNKISKLLPVIKQKCREHNFIFMQYPASLEESEKSYLRTVLRHKDGETIVGEIEIVSKDPNDPQKVGGGLTYMRRYSLTCMLGIEEEDDDAQQASQPQKQDNYNFNY